MQQARELTYRNLVDRLNRQSVENHAKAPEASIPWDRPSHAIDCHDSRWLKAAVATPFIKNLLADLTEPSAQNELAIRIFANKMKVGIQFENTLQRGLLEFANTLPNGSRDYYYAHHEILEESRHSMMFQEFIDRSGMSVGGMPNFIMRYTFIVALLGRLSPNLFMLFVLLGEAPIDYEQKKLLKEDDMPPIIQTIFQIHTVDESRHIGFAAAYLKSHVAQKNGWRKMLLSLFLPFLAYLMVFAIIAIPYREVKGLGVSFKTWRKALQDPGYRQHRAQSLQSFRTLLQQLGLMNPLARWIWRRLGLEGQRKDSRPQFSTIPD